MGQEPDFCEVLCDLPLSPSYEIQWAHISQHCLYYPVSVPGRPARFQPSNFIGPYNLHRLLLSGLGLLFRSLAIVLLDQS